MENNYYTYIIKTVKNTLYCGITNDILSRFKAHIEGKGAKYTRAFKPKEIVYLKEFENKSKASKEEYRIKKTLSRIQKLDLIEENKIYTQKLINKIIK